MPAEKTKMKETVCAFKVLSSVVEEVCGLWKREHLTVMEVVDERFEGTEF